MTCVHHYILGPPDKDHMQRGRCKLCGRVTVIPWVSLPEGTPSIKLGSHDFWRQKELLKLVERGEDDVNRDQ